MGRYAVRYLRPGRQAPSVRVGRLPIEARQSRRSPAMAGARGTVPLDPLPHAAADA